MADTSSAYSAPELNAGEKALGRKLTIYASLPGIVYFLTFSTITQNFFTALNMTPMQVGLLGSLISLCGYAQLLTSVIAEHAGHKRIYLVFHGIGLAICALIPLIPLAAGWRPAWPIISISIAIFVGMHFFNNLGFATWFAMLRAFTDAGTRVAFFSRLRLTYGWVSLTFFILIWLAFKGGDHNIPLAGFAVIFGIGWIAGITRYFIVRRFPVVTAAPGVGVIHHFRASVRDLLVNDSFRQYLWFYGAYAFVLGLSDPFIVLYIKYQLHLPDTTINLARCFWQGGGMLSLWFFRNQLDGGGGKTIYTWTASIMIAAILLLVLPMAGYPWAPALLCAIFAIKGMADFGFGLASTDAILIGAAGRNPALAIVVASLFTLTASSLAQLISGKILTHWSDWKAHLLVPLDIYRLIFLVTGGLLSALIVARGITRTAGESGFDNSQE